MTRIYRATVSYWHTADRIRGTAIAYGWDSDEAIREARAMAPDVNIVVDRVVADTYAICCECPRGHYLHAAGRLAIINGNPYCLEHGMSPEVGAEWHDYPLLRWTCLDCGDECDARHAEDHGGLCDGCADRAERMGAGAHERLG